MKLLNGKGMIPMFRQRVQLETLTDVKDFVQICSSLPAKFRIYLVDETGDQRVSATSLLGALGTVEWKETYVEATEDIYSNIQRFVRL